MRIITAAVLAIVLLFTGCSEKDAPGESAAANGGVDGVSEATLAR